ncbi:NAD(P)/FAD-dependent oxidoreductase [Phormidium sp. CCY1219]|uniref:NAD(P)/FAD-dependent oxidoreductase n=1 Tax=Phormidium sp. CCY1219 TaxID=2886104 RepID=UPI002D1F5AE6|nr:tryptophan 7-halogenase [Phormidium sp. CCY1219]MEB3829453.1 tryptophan 7-halogenase [Phormidium sp. CCY1219]
MQESDCIVIGSGPAGAAAAIVLAQQGLQPTIAEAECFPRHRPGETLHPGIEPLLQQLGVGDRLLSADFIRHTGNWIQWEGDRRFEAFGADESGEWRGFQAWRADFDSLLRDRCVELGVEIRQPCRALQPIVRQNRVIGIETNQGAIYGRFAIDATGHKHWLAKQLKLPINRYSPRLIAYYGYAQGNCPSRESNPAIVGDRKGWTWTAKVRPNLYQWTRLCFTPEKIEKDWLPPEFHSLQPWGKFSAADVTWRRVYPPAGPGYFIVGDAATVLDPASSHGVLKAIMSGMMAAHSISQILHRGRFEGIVIQGYSQWVENWFKNDVEKLRNLYALLPIAPDWV